MSILSDAKYMQTQKASRDIKLRNYERKYGSWFSQLQESKLAKYRPIDENDFIALGDKFQKMDELIQIAESQGTVDALGRLPIIKYDFLTYQHGTNPLSLVASNQSVEEPAGSILFKSVYASNSRGDVQEDEQLFSANQSPKYYKQFAVNDGVAVIDTVANQKEYEFDFGEAILKNSVSVRTDIQVGATVLNGRDDGYGYIQGFGLQGTVNTETGKGVITLIEAPEAGKKITIQVSKDVEKTGNAAKIGIGLRRKEVKCEEITLIGEFGLFQDYAIYKKVGVKADDDLIVDLSNAINFELFNRFNDAIIAAVPKSHKFGWARHKSEYTTYGQNVPEIYRKLSQLDAVMHQDAGRGKANVIIAGTNATADLTCLEGFESIETDGYGAVLKGKVQGRTVITNPGIDKDMIYGIYKGAQGFDGAGYLAVFMPFYLSDLLPGSGGNNIKRERVAATWAATGIAVPEFTASLAITEEPVPGN